MPTELPNTTPVVLIVATPVTVLLQTPPLVASVSVVLVPVQMVVVPAMAAGAAGVVNTFTVLVADVVPHELVTA